MTGSWFSPEGEGEGGDASEEERQGSETEKSDDEEEEEEKLDDANAATAAATASLLHSFSLRRWSLNSSRSTEEGRGRSMTCFSGVTATRG